MTLIASVNGPNTIWLLADRRITWPDRPPKEDAQKVMFLRTGDGLAILGYAGLGVTANGTEPSSWMHAVLDKRGLPLAESLSVLAKAIEREFPPHLAQLPPGRRSHIIVAPAFYGDWGGSSAQLYTIDPTPCLKHGQHFVVRVHDMMSKEGVPTRIPPPVTMAGSGGPALMQLLKLPKWRSTLRRMIKASSQGRIAPHAVADYLARLNHEVHKVNSTVGRRCIVVWRHRLGWMKRWGGGFLYYTDATRDHEAVQPDLMPPLVNAEAAGIYRLVRRGLAAQAGEPVDQKLESDINKMIGIPDHFPDTKLR